MNSNEKGVKREKTWKSTSFRSRTFKAWVKQWKLLETQTDETEEYTETTPSGDNEEDPKNRYRGRFYGRPSWRPYAENRISRIETEIAQCYNMPQKDRVQAYRYLREAKKCLNWQWPANSKWGLSKRLYRWWTGVDIETAWRSIHAAEALVYESMKDVEFRGRLPRINSYVSKHLADVENERDWIAAVGWVTRAYTSPLITTGPKLPWRANRKIDPELRQFIMWTFRRAQRASDDRNASVRDFRNFLIVTIVCLYAVIIAILLTSIIPDSIPVQLSYLENTSSLEATFVVMAFGSIGATVSIIQSLTKTPIPAYESRYSLDVPQLMVKLPAGAITGLSGTVIAESISTFGIFTPYDRATVFTAATIFGYGQQLVTRYVDREANRLTRSMGSPPSASGAFDRYV